MYRYLPSVHVPGTIFLGELLLLVDTSTRNKFNVYPATKAAPVETASREITLLLAWAVGSRHQYKQLLYDSWVECIIYLLEWRKCNPNSFDKEQKINNVYPATKAAPVETASTAENHSSPCMLIYPPCAERLLLLYYVAWSESQCTRTCISLVASWYCSCFLNTHLHYDIHIIYYPSNSFLVFIADECTFTSFSSLCCRCSLVDLE